MLEESESETQKTKSLKSIEEKSSSEESDELDIVSTSCPLLPSMIEDCNPLRVK